MIQEGGIQSDIRGGGGLRVTQGREDLDRHRGRGEDSQAHMDRMIHGDPLGEDHSDTGAEGVIHRDTIGRAFIVTQRGGEDSQ